MLGGETPTNGGHAANTASLVDACREARERLEGIVRALSALKDEIDRTLESTKTRPDDGVTNG